MFPFRLLLMAMLIGILIYTAIVGMNHGWNLVPIFFADMVAMNWPGQFNFDFMCFLILSATWVAWRNQFSPAGLGLSVLALFGGMLFLSIYLLYLTANASDIHEVFRGDA